MSSDYISPDAIPKWVVVCTQIAPFSSILMFLSPIPTIRHILRNGTVGDLPLLPYTTMVASCFVWIVYGIQTREPTLWCTNLVELLLSVYYVMEFTNHAPLESPTFPGSVQRHLQVCGGIWIVSIVLAIVLNADTAVRYMGGLTVVLTSTTFASPLVAVKAVWESGSSEAIPWPFTLAAMLNCFLWTIVGICDMHDFTVYFPALIGLVFALVQVGFKVYFREDSRTYSRVAASSSGELPNPILSKVRQLILLGQQMEPPTTSTAVDFTELEDPLLLEAATPPPKENNEQQPADWNPPLVPQPSRLTPVSVRSRSGSSTWKLPRF